MKIVGREQERIVMENTPEGKKEKTRKNILYAILLCLFAIFTYVYNHNPKFIGEPHVVQIDGISIVPGETTIQEITDSGYEISDYTGKTTEIVGNDVVTGYHQVIDTSSTIEGRSYYMSLKIVRDTKEYATISIVNELKSGKPMSECKIRSITFYGNEEDINNATLDNIKMNELSTDALIDKWGETEIIEEENTEGKKELTSIWEKGRYLLELVTDENGTISHVTSQYER